MSTQFPYSDCDSYQKFTPTEKEYWGISHEPLPMSVETSKGSRNIRLWLPKFFTYTAAPEEVDQVKEDSKQILFSLDLSDDADVPVMFGMPVIITFVIDKTGPDREPDRFTGLDFMDFPSERRIQADEPPFWQQTPDFNYLQDPVKPLLDPFTPSPDRTSKIIQDYLDSLRRGGVEKERGSTTGRKRDFDQFHPLNENKQPLDEKKIYPEQGILSGDKSKLLDFFDSPFRGHWDSLFQDRLASEKGEHQQPDVAEIIAAYKKSPLVPFTGSNRYYDLALLVLRSYDRRESGLLRFLAPELCKLADSIADFFRQNPETPCCTVDVCSARFALEVLRAYMGKGSDTPPEEIPDQPPSGGSIWDSIMAQ